MTHQAWCADHASDPDEPGWPGECTRTVQLAPGLQAWVSQAGAAGPVFGVDVTDSRAAAALSADELRGLCAGVDELLVRLEAGVR